MLGFGNTNDVPPISGNLFSTLFNNATIKKVRSRLDVGTENVKYARQEQVSDIPTQTIEDLYAEGEDIEHPDLTPVEKVSSLPKDSHTCLDDASSLPALTKHANSPLMANKIQVKTIYEKSCDTKTTEKIDKEISMIPEEIITGTEVTESKLSRLENIPLEGTQIITELPYKSLDLQLTERIWDDKSDKGYENTHHNIAVNGRIENLEVTQQDNINLDTQEDNRSTRILNMTVDDLVEDDENDNMSELDSKTPTLKITELNNQLSEAEKQRNPMVKHIAHKYESQPIIAFTRNKFLANFDSDDDNDDANKEDETIFENEQQQANQTYKNDISNKLPLLSNYCNELRKEFDCSKGIDLEFNEDFGSNIQLYSTNSKATLLDLRTRLSRMHVAKVTSSKTNLKEMFGTLKKASKKQILEHQRKVVESKGLDLKDIRKEQEAVENLLEREILRTRRIRQLEKNKEMKDASENSNGEDEIFDHSANEIYSSGDEESDQILDEISDSGDDVVSVGPENDLEDTGKNSAPPVNDDDEQLLPVFHRNARKKLIIHDRDSEMDSDTDQQAVIPSKNAIDLGHYGDNISSSPLKGDEALDVNYQEDEENDPESEFVDDDQFRLLIDQTKAEFRLKEKVRRDKRKELSKGLKNLMEEEAEESEDEWHGIGGIDGEQSDEYDSELEKMIDDYSKSNFDAGEIRKMLADEDKSTDMQMVNKILRDIKNGGFRKRARNTLELDLSDDEDDVLREYRIKKRELMKQKRLELDDSTKLIENPKTRSFFDSITEDIVDKIDPFKPDDDIVNDGVDSGQDLGEDNNKTNKDNERNTISQEFVQKTLSFLTNNDDLEKYEKQQMLAYQQHGSETQDFLQLKQQSSIKSFSSASEQPSQMNDVEHADEVNGNLAYYRHPSISKAFASRFNFNDKFKNGTKTVHVPKAYKIIGGSKTSVTYFGKMRKLHPPKKKYEKLERESQHRNLFMRKSFEIGNSSFEN